MSFETYRRIEENADVCIKPQKSVTFTFDGSGNENASRLFMTGETNIAPYWKTEPDYKSLYIRIDDSLNSEKANRDRFCLDFSSKRKGYTTLVFKKMVAPLRTPMFVLNNCPSVWKFGISVFANNLRVYGFLRVILEIRLKKEGIDKHETAQEPDCIYTIDIPQGKYDWQKLEQEVFVDIDNLANVCYYVEGKDYEGEVYFEAPTFAFDKHNIVGQFEPMSNCRNYINWVGQNLSRIEWIGMKVDINGENVFDGEIFERCHRFSEAELPLPKNLIKKGENTITFTCTTSFNNAPGYNLREWGFITDKNSCVISYPNAVTLGKVFYVCVEGRQGEVFAFSSEHISLACENVLKNDGLNAIAMVCNTLINDVKFSINGEEFTIQRCVEKDDDGIITGTGDMIYAHVTERNLSDYIKWYLSNNIGNLLTIRPTYRWNGSRDIDFSLYTKLASLLDDMGIYYSHMLDGRELPGGNGNPTKEEIDSKHFLGRQMHEFDGQFVYWGTRDVTGNIYEQMSHDLFIRMGKEVPDRTSKRFTPTTFRCGNGKQYVFKTPYLPTDMKTASENFVDILTKTKSDATRHTGPATLFKYFYQAGYKWTGAELMYSPTELTISALRGAADTYGGKIGAHNAVQWSTSPHDTQSRYRRYRLAQFICYMQGIDEINTEEGLWRLEEYYNFHHRFSPACVNHTKIQQDLYKFITTHTRRGKFYTPIAFLNGRYDGWRTFGKGNPWGVHTFTNSDAEEAWNVLNFFYPKSVQDALYRHNCPDKEIGYYTGTPFGNVDIIPIEKENFAPYNLLVAVGYNKAEKEDLEKWENYLSGGGTILLGWPQLSITVDRKDVTNYNHEYIIDKKFSFIPDTYKGNTVNVCENMSFDDVLIYTDNNRPLVGIKNVNSGKVYFVNAKEYAGNAGVDNAYCDALSVLTTDCLSKEKVYAKGNRNVQFTVFEKEDGGREFYFIATDWHKANPDGEGVLILDKTEYAIPVPWGQTVKVVTASSCAMYPEKDENEVISLSSSFAKVQGYGIAKFILLKDGKTQEFVVDFTSCSVATIQF